jgi:hypothetical protein
LSSQNSAPKKRLGARIVRAFFVGLSVGFAGGFGVYLLALAVNTLQGTPVLSPLAFLLLVLGFTTVASVGIELSKDLENA